MKKLRLAVIALAAPAFIASHPCLGGAAAQAQTQQAPRREKQPAVQDQIGQLRQQLQSQIDELKQELAGKDKQLQQTQQAAKAAQSAADKDQAAANDQQQAVSQNASAVGTLQSSVNELKSSSSSMQSSFTSIQKDTTEIKKAVTEPDAIHFKGITLSPTGSYLAAETVWRQGAVGGGINTPFTGVPLNNSDLAQVSEFQGTGRQSRLALKAVGNAGPFTMTGFYEMDWLGTGVTSNNNQSNSYVLRQRQVWADASLKNGWDFSGGQGWSMATETTNLLARGSEILPATIDAQYEAGFVWTRQYSFRVVKNFRNSFALGISAENAETLNPSGQNFGDMTSAENVLIGDSGQGGGLYNSTANYSFNATPDFIAKIAAQPGWGHWELFGIGRSFRDRIYPTSTSPYYSAGTAPFNNTVWAGGIGGSVRGSLASKKVSLGLKGLWGEGVGRYGSSTIADVTFRPDGTLSPLHGFSALSTLELFPTPRWYLYFNYGGDYVGRDWTNECLNSSGNPVLCNDPTAVTTAEVGYGPYTTNMSGCTVEPAAGSGTVNGGTGFSPKNPSNCGNNNKDVQEFTAGYWYNFYKGPKGSLRYGLQYSWFQRDLWSGAGGRTNPGGGAKGVDNMFWTSFRYYLP